MSDDKPVITTTRDPDEIAAILRNTVADECPHGEVFDGVGYASKWSLERWRAKRAQEDAT